MNGTVRTRRRLAGWCLAIAGLALPATVAVAVWGGAAGTAGAPVIGTIALAALAAAQAFLREAPLKPAGQRRRGSSATAERPQTSVPVQ
ncbi:hypothetical protein [Dactylosporangium sp. CA-092794]|uniref:hypothetical protein n=1 Tax=Dactylosporangium sp. CA-092794 TaxID=3239929 RepID=UPI003D93360B